MHQNERVFSRKGAKTRRVFTVPFWRKKPAGNRLKSDYAGRIENLGGGGSRTRVLN